MAQLLPRLDPSSGEALYLQLYRFIRDEIIAGRIAADSRLPSVRKLADSLGLSRTPVSLAYDQLLSEGYAVSKPRSGVFAKGMEQMIGNRNNGKNTAPFTKPIFQPALPQRAYHDTLGDKSIEFDFGYGRVDLAGFPLNKWRRLVNRCLLVENSRLLLYGDLQGDWGLRAEIASYLYQFRGVRCSPEQIVIGAGTYHSLALLFQLLEDEVTTLVTEAAVNDGVLELLKQSRFAWTPARLEPDGICLEDVFASCPEAVYVTPSHQFPFGMVLSAAKRMQLLGWAKRQGAYIIENDYDGEFRYAGHPIPSLQSLDDNGRVIYLGTFSRALTPAFRLSYLVLPHPLLEKFRQDKRGYDQLASPIFQRALLWFMQSGDFERHMRKMRTLYRRKHDALLLAVKQSFGSRARVIGPGSGLHILLQLEGRGEAELIGSARKAGVAVYPTSPYMLRAPADEDESAAVLLGFGGLSITDLQEGMERLARAWY